MDRRAALPPGTWLSFPGLNCQVTGEIGRGSNAIVYRGWYADHRREDERREVLIKELFPLHTGGAIYRDESGSVFCAPEAEQAHIVEMQRRSFEAGNAVHLMMSKKYPTEYDGDLYTYELNNTLYTILEFSGGRSLADDFAGPAAALRPLAERLLKLLDALEGFHEAGYLHLDIAPDNIMLLDWGRRERVILIDYNSCQLIDDSPNAHAAFSVKPGYTAPEVRGGRARNVGPWSDLYAAAAIFYHGIAGEPLTPFQMMRPVPPDVSRCPCVAAMPETVQSWIQRILKSGLCALPSKRYQSVAEMRGDMIELLDRIDGAGVTHRALWEAGWRHVERMIQNNPSLSFIRDEAALYPSNAKYGGKVWPMADHLAAMLAPRGESALLIAGGGMGKTAAMLRAAYSQSRNYAPAQPAIAYVSLYGWAPDERDYILNRVLEAFRFKPDAQFLDDARRVLANLLDHPLPDPDGPKPALLLMLDGLNEVTGDTWALHQEIIRLSRLRGVRVLAAARADESALPFRRLLLSQLQTPDIQKALSGAGLSLPDAPQTRSLLRTPLMLSMFIQAARSVGKPPDVASQEALIGACFDALIDDALSGQPKDAPERRQIEAAVYAVLPAMAREFRRRRRALTNAELLEAVADCYRMFGARSLRLAFPRWIGQSAAIIGGAKSAEAWYRQIVREILWKRLGLLLRDDQGRYQVCHSIIEDYLLGLDRENRRRVRRMRRLRQGLSAALACAVLAGSIAAYHLFIRPKPYDPAQAEKVYVEMLEARTAAGQACEDLRDLLACASETPEYYGQMLAHMGWAGDASPDAALGDLEALLQTGSAMPWSGVPVNGPSCERLLSLPYELRQTYSLIAQRVGLLLSDDIVSPEYKRLYLWAAAEVVRRDARIADSLFAVACEPHMTGKHRADASRPGEAVLENTDALLSERNALLNALLPGG